MKRGFTLIELLAVIVLLGVIVTIITSSVISTMNKSKESLSDTQIETIENAASRWVTLNADKLPRENGKYVDVSIDDLASAGYLDASDLENPSNGKKICGYVRITYVNNDTYKNQFNYDFNEKSC